MGQLSFWQIAVIAIIVILLFGGRGKITSVMSDFGSGLKAFKKSVKDDEKENDTSSTSTPDEDNK